MCSGLQNGRERTSLLTTFLVRSRFHCNPCTLLGGQYFHQPLYCTRADILGHRADQCNFKHIINTRQDSCHMRYRVVNLSQQNAYVLLKHLYCLPAGFLELPQTALKYARYRGETALWLHGGSFKIAPRTFANAVVSQKERQVHEAEGSQAPGLLRPWEPPAFGVHATAHLSGVH